MTEKGEPSEQQLQAKLKIINYLDKNFCRERDYREYCLIGAENNTNVCKGDSGSGMVYEINGRWYIYGLVSHGILNDDATNCDNTQPAFFTMVPKYLDWILRAMRATFSPDDFFISFI